MFLGILKMEQYPKFLDHSILHGKLFGINLFYKITPAKTGKFPCEILCMTPATPEKNRQYIVQSSI